MRSTTRRPERRRTLGFGFSLALPAALAGWALHRMAPTAEIAPPRVSAAPGPEPAAALPTAPTAPSSAGLRLHGVLGRHAIISGPQGGQRLVPIGREAAPGLVLREIGLHWVTLAWSSGTVELTLDGREPNAAPAATAAVAPPRATQREETLPYRLGLAPRREEGRITGFILRREADLPLLRRAGLRPGDVLVSVNGMSFDSEEKVLELPGEIAGSYTAEFEFERAGRRLRASLPINPRT